MWSPIPGGGQSVYAWTVAYCYIVLGWCEVQFQAVVSPCMRGRLHTAALIWGDVKTNSGRWSVRMCVNGFMLLHYSRLMRSPIPGGDQSAYACTVSYRCIVLGWWRRPVPGSNQSVYAGTVVFHSATLWCFGRLIGWWWPGRARPMVVLKQRDIQKDGRNDKHTET